MDPVTWQEALDANVARYRSQRWRWLCSDDNPDARSREGYRLHMVELATGVKAALPTTPGVRESLALIDAMKRCPYRSRDAGCGCNGSRCGLRPAGRQIVSHQDCFNCLRAYPDVDQSAHPAAV